MLYEREERREIDKGSCAALFSICNRIRCRMIERRRKRRKKKPSQDPIAIALFWKGIE
jgi:hypothetical protein